MGSRDFGIFVCLCIAALAAGLVWVSVQDDEMQAGSDPRVGVLSGRVAALERKLASDRDPQPPASDPRLTALVKRVAAVERAATERETATAARLAKVERELTALRKEVDNRLEAHAEQLAALRRATRGRATPTRSAPAIPLQCLRQLQQEIDDLRGYVRFRDPIRRRVTSPCTALLRPRWGG
jgi:hypothetical protein